MRCIAAEMTMKKLLCLALAVCVMLCTLCACGKKDAVPFDPRGKGSVQYPSGDIEVWNTQEFVDKFSMSFCLLGTVESEENGILTVEWDENEYTEEYNISLLELGEDAALYPVGARIALVYENAVGTKAMNGKLFMDYQNCRVCLADTDVLSGSDLAAQNIQLEDELPVLCNFPTEESEEQSAKQAYLNALMGVRDGEPTFSEAYIITFGGAQYYIERLPESGCAALFDPTTGEYCTYTDKNGQLWLFTVYADKYDTDDMLSMGVYMTQKDIEGLLPPIEY